MRPTPTPREREHLSTPGVPRSEVESYASASLPLPCLIKRESKEKGAPMQKYNKEMLRQNERPRGIIGAPESSCASLFPSAAG